MLIPVASVFGAFAIIYLLRFPVIVAQLRRPEGLDNHHPRDQQARLEGWARRANAAHQNSFEAFAPFAAAVILAVVTGADARWRDALCLVFVGARLVYPVCYIVNVATLRSAIWSLGFGAVAGLFVLSTLAAA